MRAMNEEDEEDKEGKETRKRGREEVKARTMVHLVIEGSQVAQPC